MLGPRARGQERAVQPTPLRRRSRRQDVRNGDPNLLCSEGAWGRGARMPRPQQGDDGRGVSSRRAIAGPRAPAAAVRGGGQQRFPGVRAPLAARPRLLDVPARSRRSPARGRGRAAGRGSLSSPRPDRCPGRRCSRTSGWCGRSGGCSCAACSGTTPGSTCAGPPSRASRSPCCAWRWASSAPPPPPPGAALPGTGTSCSCSSGPRRPAGGCGPPLPPRSGPPRGGGAGRSRSAVRSRGPPDAAVPGAGREPSAGPAAPLLGEAPPGLRAAGRERPPRFGWRRGAGGRWAERSAFGCECPGGSAQPKWRGEGRGRLCPTERDALGSVVALRRECEVCLYVR